MEEENVLEYRPSFEREERLATNWITDDSIAPGKTTPKPQNGTPGSGIVTETVSQLQETKEVLVDKLKAIEKTKIIHLTFYSKR